MPLKVIYVPIVLFRNTQKANHFFMQYPINQQFTPPRNQQTEIRDYNITLSETQAVRTFFMCAPLLFFYKDNSKNYNIIKNRRADGI